MELASSIEKQKLHIEGVMAIRINVLIPASAVAIEPLALAVLAGFQLPTDFGFIRRVAALPYQCGGIIILAEPAPRGVVKGATAGIRRSRVPSLECASRLWRV